MRLGEQARNTLRASNIDPDVFAKLHGDASADTWSGDACGCTDDRCIGYHHADHEACGCITAEIDSYWENIHAGEEGREVWAAHEHALTTGRPEDRMAADTRAAEWIATYHRSSTSYSLTETPRGITTRNRYNDHSWLVFDAVLGQATVEQLV
jgi:hypothetical protein